MEAGVTRICWGYPDANMHLRGGEAAEVPERLRRIIQGITSVDVFVKGHLGLGHGAANFD